MNYPHFYMFDNSPVDQIDLRFFWEKMKEENKIKKIFWDDSVKTYEEFTEFVNKSWFFFGFDNYRLVGGVWFYDFVGKECKIGICAFNGYIADRWGNAINGLLDWVLDNNAHKVYNIVAITPYKGFERLFKSYAFLSKGKDKKGFYRLVRAK